jgi:cytochrome d ubiquinol oxidase subunit II
VDLPTVWFLILGVLLMGYAILDGFDLGVGMLHLRVPGDRDRRLVLNSIGPLWDGNEVWLVTFGGALFAAFPDVYATLLSGFYVLVMVILLGLIGRAISLEFRGKSKSRHWRTYWDLSFFASSFAVTFVFGVALGNVVAGIPIGPDHEFAGRLGDLLSPYALATGVLAVTGAAMHGAIYLHLKTEGDLQRRAHRFMWETFFAFAVTYVVVSVWTVATIPHATANFERWPAAWIVVVLNVLAVANIPRALHQGRPAYAFVSSCCTIAALTFLVAMALFPDLAISSIDPDYGIDIWEGSSSESTLRLMGIVVLIGAPLVATYTAIVYWVFRGKVKLDKTSY